MHCKLALSSSALAFILSGNLASADITGAELWAEWQSYLDGVGYEMTGTQSQSGDRLTISDTVMTFTLPEDGGVMTYAVGTLELVDNADGTVSVIYPETISSTMDLTPAEGEPVKIGMTFSHTAPQMVVSGQMEDLLYTYVSEAMGFALDSLEVDGEPMPQDMFNVSMGMDDVSLVMRMTAGDLREYTQDIKADQLRFDLSYSVPEQNSQGSFNGQFSNVDFQGAGSAPLEMDTVDFGAMIAAGLDARGQFTYSDGSANFAMDAPEGTFEGQSSASTGLLAVEMGSEGLTYELEQRDVNMGVQVPEFPLPIAMDIASTTGNFTIPVQSGPDEQDFAYGFSLEGFTFSDSIWGLFDPAGQLPRDPATFVIDLTGTAKILVDFLDPEQTAQIGLGEALGELNSLDINSLVLSAVGATITGEGGFTFDNSDTTTFDGMPRPNGAIDIRAEGVNALIDKLVNMGLVPQEQAMGARMMMGLFTVPESNDVLTSRIEVNDEGRVLANGQMIR